MSESSSSDEWNSDPESDGELQLERRNSYSFIKSSDIEERLNSLVLSFSDMFGVSTDETLVLLIQYQWASHKLQEDWLENELQVRVNCGLSLPQPGHVIASSTRVKLGKVRLYAEPQGNCEICYNHIREKDALQCGHTFCSGCWKEYLIQCVLEGPICLSIQCPRFGCSLVVPESMKRRYLDSSQCSSIYSMYLRLKYENFVLFSKGYRWCPAPGCVFIAEFPGLGMHEILCKCGNLYCFACGEEGHRPALCKQLRDWQVKNSAESENVRWILANTKQCPKCRKPIEKNQGCNHMTCRKEVGGCGHEFCWLCLGPWTEHNSSTGGYYKCNKYEEEMQSENSSVKKEESKRAEAKTELERYMFYFERFNNHFKAQKLAKSQLPEVETKMQLLHSAKQFPIGEMEFLKEGAQQVVECRRILKCSYVFGYYLEQGLEKNLFEHLQEKLEENTEHLHELAEKKLDAFMDPMNPDKAPFYQYKSDLTNYTQVTKRFMSNLLDGIDNGLTAFI